MMKVIVCRRQDHNLEMEAAVAGPPLPAVSQEEENKVRMREGMMLMG